MRITSAIVYLLCFTFGLIASLSAQSINPAAGEVFTDEVVPRIDISMDADSLIWMLDDENLESDLLITGSFQFNNGTIDETLENIGFRLRGNTSRSADKKSFKVDFNAFEKGRKFYGLEKMNLNGQHNDPSISRAKICSDIGTALNIPMMRTNHVRLYINGDFRGVYLNVEHIDEEFAGARFGNETGNMYKCLYPADLAYKGTNPNAYKEVIFGRRAYDLKSDKLIQDYEDFAEFVDILNNTSPSNFACELEQVFNVDRYLRCIVFDVLTGNWDGPIYNQNNFYLYHNDETDLFEYIPYDVDNTLGIDWLNRDWAERNIYTWSKSGADRPIYNKIMENQVYRDRYTYYMKQALDDIFNMDQLSERLDDMRANIVDYVDEDPYYSQDYGFTSEDFYQAFEFGDLPYQQTDYNLKAYIDARHEFASDQLDNNNMAPIINMVNYKLAEHDENRVFTAKVIDNIAVSSVQIRYNYGAGNEFIVDMADDGLSEDGIAGDGIFGVILEPTGQALEMSFQIIAMDINSQETTYPACHGVQLLIEDLDIQLSINEILTVNSHTNIDEYVEYDDWIELYNYGVVPIDLHDKYITDDPGEPNKWRLPNQILLPNAYALVWADDDNEQGKFHSNFKLSSSAGYVGIFDEQDDGFILIDELTYDQQDEDISWARLPNGTGAFAFAEPTPLESNSPVAVQHSEDTSLDIYPNPTSEHISIHSTHFSSMDLSIRNIQGQEVMRVEVHGHDNITVAQLESGVYFCTYLNDQGARITQKFIKI